MEEFYDESGELGLSKKSSRHFIMAGFSPENHKEVERAFKKFKAKLYKKKKIHMLHARDDDNNTKVKFVKFLQKQSWKAKVFIFQKGSARYTDYFEILKIIHANTEAVTEKINIATFQNKKIFTQKVKVHFPRIHFSTPEDLVLMQVADFIAWVCFKKYEHNDSFYFDLLAKNLEIISMK